MLKSRKGLAEVGRWFGPRRWTSELKRKAEGDGTEQDGRGGYCPQSNCGLLGISDDKNCILRLEGQLLPPPEGKGEQTRERTCPDTFVIQAAVRKIPHTG